MPESGGLHEPVIRDGRVTARSREGGEAEADTERREGSSSSSSSSSNRVYVAVGRSLKEGRNNLMWSFRAFPGAKVVILHVHQPAQMVPGPYRYNNTTRPTWFVYPARAVDVIKRYLYCCFVLPFINSDRHGFAKCVGGKVHASKVKTSELNSYRERERQDMINASNDFLRLCAIQKVQAERLTVESEDVGKGIVELVAQSEIAELVMGAAADKNFSKRMKSPTSKKAIYVNQQALPSCRIWFVCKGILIQTRDSNAAPLSTPSSPAIVRLLSPAATLSPSRSSEDSEASGRTSSLASWSTSPESHYPDLLEVVAGGTEEVPSSDSVNSVGRVWSACEASLSSFSSSSSLMLSTERIGVEEYAPLEPATGDLQPVDQFFPSTEPAEEQEHSKEMEGLLDRLKKAMEEAQTSKREAFQESQWRQQAEQEALRKARLAEASLAKEQKRRSEAEAALSRERLELQRLVVQHKDIMEDLHDMSTEKSSLERRIADLEHELQVKSEKLENVQNELFETEREKLEMMQQRDDAITKFEELRSRQEELGEPSRMVHSFTEFSLAELVDATNGFDPGLKIGEGGFGSVYRGRIRYTTVAIKMLNAESMQGGSEFHQEVNVLSRLRHPHLITLIGACTESCALVYEYLPNGSLEDRISCKDGTPPLTWQARTCIAAEICSALLFLHSAGVVHGDLKPGNILLDANLSVKIGDFGICRLLPEQDSTISCVTTNPKGTFAYMDPEFLGTGELTPFSDVYSFGVIILQLLTGRPPLWIARDVQKALSAGNLQAIMDLAAGDWPFVQAVQLANLGLACCSMSRRCRPELESEVWRLLEPLKGSLALATHSMLGTDPRQPPEYFICPIFQEIMRDPQVAADGFTYEAEALRGWLDSGHDTSPMTNLKLSHLNLTPNHALRSAIQEWLGRS